MIILSLYTILRCNSLKMLDISTHSIKTEEWTEQYRVPHESVSRSPASSEFENTVA